MISRVTNLTTMQAAQRNLQAGATKMARLQDQASSQRAINRPSDDPAGTVESMRVRAAQRSNDQYARNIDDGNGWLTTVDSTLGRASDIMRRVRDLTVQGANDGAMSPTAKEAIAVELEGLKADLMVQANAEVRRAHGVRRQLSAGRRAVDSTTYVFNGAGNSPVNRRIGDDTTVQVDADGDSGVRHDHGPHQPLRVHPAR